MTYYADLSPYTYLPDTAPADKTVLNVGWLDKDHPYPTGTPPETFLQRLGILCLNPVMRTRGMHWCELCPEDELEYPVTPTIEGTPTPLGGAEVRVPTADGTILAAPDLIYHYVEKHHYLPPSLVIESVLAQQY
ncbi:hypothetical protein VMT65_35165 [Nocardia sp. CDC153]|uniref:DUF7919 family protein n=1 Tax=Nocardia sp. CDC153 TaxID=3112167 RepID=UPI002DBB0999|nr:hypothetical protein [Nocardia sp. CDC153]MEC3958318.1 hypothetical protein [Nocardia sp. CDC153]